jgi:hypothetical protein
MERTLGKDPLTSHFLLLTCRQIVGACPTQHVVHSLIRADVLARPADDDGQFDLVVELLVLRGEGNGDRCARVGEGLGGFGEDGGRLGDRQTHLFLEWSTWTTWMGQKYSQHDLYSSSQYTGPSRLFLQR